jgi:ribosomal protein S18 acetylase RimI-like enzyme
MIIIKKIGAENVGLIRELTFKIWPQTYSTILSDEQINYMLDMMYSNSALKKQINDYGHQFIVAYDDQKPVAFASYSQKSADDDRTYRLHKIYILPNQQGKGIGKKLLEYIVADIQGDGATVLELNVNRYNPAKTFYEKLGFSVSWEEDIDIGNGFYMNDYVMTKNLDDE